MEHSNVFIATLNFNHILFLIITHYSSKLWYLHIHSIIHHDWKDKNLHFVFHFHSSESLGIVGGESCGHLWLPWCPCPATGCSAQPTLYQTRSLCHQLHRRPTARHHWSQQILLGTWRTGVAYLRSTKKEMHSILYAYLQLKWPITSMNFPSRGGWPQRMNIQFSVCGSEFEVHPAWTVSHQCLNLFLKRFWGFYKGNV